MLQPRLHLYLLGLLVFSCPRVTIANPQNPQITEGHANIQYTNELCKISAKDKSIIHWENFSIAPHETTQFELPSPQAAVLNRVTGDDPSTLLGKLSANGTVYLINPHGILVGKEGMISVGSFVASTLDVTNQDFLLGNDLLFSGESQALIENQGHISAMQGDIVLLAQAIRNFGDLQAMQGVIALGAAKEIFYRPYGDERIQIQITSEQGECDRTGVLQSGTLQSHHSELKADGNLYGYAIKNEGYIEALCVENIDGHVYLVAEQGHVNHTGVIQGHEARLLGKYVTLTENGSIDVSSADQGGTVLIGGEYQGSNPEIINAQATLIEKNVSIKADALENGSGGRVIVWANEATGFYGAISARGGEYQGDGGFVEVSGREQLEFLGQVDTRAPQGKTGVLLLDPTDITISAAATDAGITFGGACGVNTFCNTGALSPRNINNTAITTQLGLSNVIVAATPGGPAGGNGDITFSAGAPFTWTGVNTNTFTLNARRNININDNFTNSTSAGNVTFMTGLGVLGVFTSAAAATISHSSTGTMTINANTTAGSDITLNGPLNVTGGNLSIVLSDDFTSAATGTINFNSPGNLFSYSTTTATNSVTTFGAAVTINGAANWNTVGTININSNLTTNGSNNVVISSTGTITKSAGTPITHNSSGTFSMSTTAAGASIALNGPFTISATGGSTTLSSAVNLQINAGFANNSPTSNATLTAGTAAVGAVSLAAAQTLSHSSSGTLLLNANTTAGSDITINGILNVTNGTLNITLDDDFTLAASPASFTYNSPGNTMSFTTNAAAGSIATFNGPININGNSNWTTSGTLNFNDAVTINGTGTMTVSSVGSVSTGTASIVNYNSTGNLGWTVTGAGSDITIGGMFTVPSANATFHPEDDFTLTATTGIFNYSAAGQNLIFNSGTSTTYNFNGALSVTGGNLTITAFDDINIAATTGSIVYNVVGGSCSFLSSGGGDPDFNINGNLTVTNGALTAITFDDIIIAAGTGSLIYNSSNTANLSATGVDGDITINGTLTATNASMNLTGVDSVTTGATSVVNWNSPGTLVMNAQGTDVVIGGVFNATNGNVTMIAVDDVTLGAACNMAWSSPGTLTMTTTAPLVGSTVNTAGTVNFTNGTWTINSQGSITTAGVINYSAPNPFTLTSVLGGATFNGPVNLNTAAMFNLTVVDALNVNALITNTFTGAIRCTVGGNTFVGTATGLTPSRIGSAGGLTRLDIGGSLVVQSSQTTPGATSFVGFSSGSQQADIDIDVVGDCVIHSENNNNDAGIISTQQLNLHIGGDLLLQGSNITGDTGLASIQAQGDIFIDPVNVFLFSVDGGPPVEIETSLGNITVIALDNFTITGNSSITNTGPGNITIVIDQQAPVPPLIGNGAFNMDHIATITTTGGQLSLFTAVPGQNAITGLLNGATLSQGNQVFGVYYSTFSGFSPPPFTIYYKSAGVTPIPINFGDTLAEVAFSSAELTQQYLDRTMGWGWTCPYRICDNYSQLLASRAIRWSWNCPYRIGDNNSIKDWNSYLIKQERGQTLPEFTCAEDDFCEDHPLFKRKDFEYPIYLKPCCYQNDYVN